MQEKLNDIAQMIEDYFTEEVWHLPPPIKEIDYKLSLLAHKIYKLRDNIKEVNDLDKEISNIMTHIELEFKVPMLGANIPKWLEEDRIRHDIILKVYNQLSNLRSL